MQLLETLYRIWSPTGNENAMREFLVAWLEAKKIKYEVDKAGNILVTKGKAKYYPCIAAHIDEVHKNRPQDFVVMRSDRVMFGFSPSIGRMVGIGADDKNGVWIALRLLDHIKNMKAVFFVGEEIGCKGAENIDLKFFDNCKFIIECDRSGSGDFIYTAMGIDLCTAGFMDKVGVKSYGYTPTRGRSTDVVTLARRGVKVSVCNVSCGYYSEHTANEITRYDDLLKCYKMVLHAFNTVTKSEAPYRSPKTLSVADLSTKYSVKPSVLGKMRQDYFQFINSMAKTYRVSDIEELSLTNPRLKRMWDYCKRNSPIGRKLVECQDMTLSQVSKLMYIRPYHVELMMEILYPQLNGEDRILGELPLESKVKEEVKCQKA